jgi:hypothetical protein
LNPDVNLNSRWLSADPRLAALLDDLDVGLVIACNPRRVFVHRGAVGGLSGLEALPSLDPLVTIPLRSFVESVPCSQQLLVGKTVLLLPFFETFCDARIL